MHSLQALSSNVLIVIRVTLRMHSLAVNIVNGGTDHMSHSFIVLVLRDLGDHLLLLVELRIKVLEPVLVRNELLREAEVIFIHLLLLLLAEEPPLFLILCEILRYHSRVWVLNSVNKQGCFLVDFEIGIVMVLLYFVQSFGLLHPLEALQDIQTIAWPHHSRDFRLSEAGARDHLLEIGVAFGHQALLALSGWEHWSVWKIK
mmetsp:Transcript_34170/g.52447  ORF Transcript_34170/g.52447 Transcript_34170/m.52447 type:complete len:202 (-) Transcript_34170:794-1399(-)